MRASIAMILLGVFFVFMIYMEIDQDLSTLLNERVKNGVNRATHDASLCIDIEEYADGRIIFNHQEAKNAFERTLALNLGLKPEDLTPRPGTSFTDKAVIELIDYIDDEDGVNYPYLYQNAQFGITKVLRGPAVISVVKIRKPVFCSLSAKFDYRKWAVYEYPVPR